MDGVTMIEAEHRQRFQECMAQAANAEAAHIAEMQQRKSRLEETPLAA